VLLYISYVAKAPSLLSQFSIFTADCLCHPIQMAGVETIWELHTLPVIGASLSEPHTSVTAFVEVVCMWVRSHIP